VTKKTLRKKTSTPPPSVSFAIAGGKIWVDPRDGCPIRAQAPVGGPAEFLLDEKYPFFQAPHRWGKGFVLLQDGRACKWGQPDHLSVAGKKVLSLHSLDGIIKLEVVRHFEDHWTEEYTWRNVSRRSLTLTSIGIRTPFRDVYSSAVVSLRECCHAHLFPGGNYAFAWAWPMNGAGPGLGLRVTKGALWAYSMEGRNQFSSSNFRGHILLHPTDAARAPRAFGGQPVIRLRPGESHSLRWEIGVYADWNEFRSRLVLPVDALALSAQVGDGIALRVQPRSRIKRQPGLLVRRSAASATVTCSQPGEHYVDVNGPRGDTRLALQFHPPIRKVVETRIDYILSRQRATERDFPRDGSFLPVDVRNGLRIDGGEWQDWSDARERLAMPALLQEARRRNWHDAATLDRALHHFSRYAIDCLLGPAGEVWENSYLANPDRLYNYPWLAEFFLGQYQLFHDPADLKRAGVIVEAYYRRGGGKFLAIWDGILPLMEALRTVGQTSRARSIEKNYLHQATALLAQGADLPAHEVNYEQSIVAPLALLLLGAYEIHPDESYRRQLGTVLSWLEAFGGPQPHCRLRNIPIRHWDGYWFGLERLWGDVFPHYWSVLSARAFLRAAPLFPDRSERYRGIARDIYASNLLNFFPDGGATCAFVFPSAVDGRPAHLADPLANDQDWALVWLLRDNGVSNASFSLEKDTFSHRVTSS
jgi:hypothetical protein